MGEGTLGDFAPNSKAELRSLEGNFSQGTVLLQCEICMEFIATIESARLFYPMDGTMFTSVDPYHGVPDPFHPTMNWETMRCPHCRMRPFVADDVIKTSIGMMAVPIRGEATEVATPPLTATPKVTAKKKPTKVSTKVEESAPENAEDNPLSAEEILPFVCEKCGKAFERKNQLQGHKMQCKATAPVKKPLHETEGL